MLIQANHIVDLSKVKRLSEDHLTIHKQFHNKETNPILYGEIGRAHVWTPVTVNNLVCRLLLEKKKQNKKKKISINNEFE